MQNLTKGKKYILLSAAILVTLAVILTACYIHSRPPHVESMISDVENNIGVYITVVNPDNIRDRQELIDFDKESIIKYLHTCTMTLEKKNSRDSIHIGITELELAISEIMPDKSIRSLNIYLGDNYYVLYSGSYGDNEGLYVIDNGAEVLRQLQSIISQQLP